MGIFHEIQTCPDPELYWARQHSDLMVQLCQIAQTKNLAAFTCKKIKSHQVISNLEDSLDQYFAMGSRFADELARTATGREKSPLHAFCWEVAEWYTKQVQLLQAVQPFLAGAEIMRLDGLQQQTPNVDLAVKESFSIEHEICGDPNHSNR